LRATFCRYAALIGAQWNETSAQHAMDALATDYQPLTDMRASGAYRMKVARNLLWRCWPETRDDAPLALCDVNAFAFAEGDDEGLGFAAAGVTP